MGTFTTRNTPLLAADDGSQSETLAGTQLLTTLFDVPVEANSAWLQAATDVLFRIDGSTSGSAWLTLPAKTFLPLTNRSQLNALVLSGSSVVAVQFMAGALGPMPPAPVVASTGGGGIPGEGTVTSVDAFSDIDQTGYEFSGGPITGSGTLIMTGRARVDTDNAVHVMVNGNDSTGQRGRLDKPFASFTAALAASVVADAIVCWPGSYEVVEATVKNRSIVLIGAELVCSVAALYMLSCEGVVSITGSGYSGLRGTVASESAVIKGLAGCTVMVDVMYLRNAGTQLALADGEGCAITCTAADMACGRGTAIVGWERAEVRGTIDAALTAYRIDSGNELLHYGDVSGTGVVVEVDGGDVTIYGNVRGSSNSGAAVIRTNGVASVKVYGDIIASGSAMDGIKVESGTARIDVYGNIQALQLASVNVESTDAGSIISIHGDIECAARHGILTHTADITVWGNISTGGLITDANAVHAIGPSTVRVYGHLSSVAGAAAKTSNTGAIIELFGNAHSTGRWGIFCINGGHIIIHGVASSSTREGAYCEIGQLTILGGAASANDTPPVIMLTPEAIAGNLVTLGGGAYLRGTAGTLYSVDMQPGGVTGVRSYGAYGNKPLNPSLVPVGKFNDVP